MDFEGFLGEAIAVDRDLDLGGESDESLGMVGVFVSDEDTVEVFRGASDGEKALADLPSTQAGVDEKSCVGGFDVGAVTAGSAAQHGDEC